MRIISEDKKALVPVSIHLPVNGACCLEEENHSSELAGAGDGLAEAVYSTGQPQLLQSRPAVEEEELEASLQDNGEKAQSLMIVPLRAQGRSLGTLSALRFHKDPPYMEDDLVFFQDIAGRAALAIENALLHTEVQRLAITDALTEVYNRRGLFELGRREIERSRRFNRPLSVIMVDLDKFKDVNDTYGHAAGDQVLRAVARRLSDSLREVDMIGRYGGDEFIILLPETDLYTACAVAERIRQRVIHPITVGALPFGEIVLHLTASLGVCSLSADPQDLAGLIDRADAASYRAKHNGRNNIQIG